MLSRFVSAPGYDINMPLDPYGNSLFHICSHYGKLDMLALLHSRFTFDFNRYNAQGQTCAHLAAENAHLDALEWLRDHGADLHLPTLFYKKTPAEVAKFQLKRTSNHVARNRLRAVIGFLRETYAVDMNEHERVKCLFVLKYGSAPWQRALKKVHWAIVCDFV